MRITCIDLFKQAFYAFYRQMIHRILLFLLKPDSEDILPL